ncbi:MAG: bifunctional adenosylcobinamide kinase/adenosylcobinamide-phosphate guanylyltransferase [Anaerovorax sp.]
MNLLISGGCKNGKSYYAQRRAQGMHKELVRRMGAEAPSLYYLATMEPKDEEDVARIKRHVEERKGWGFTTIEKGRDLCACLKKEGENEQEGLADPRGVFLLDSVTALLSNEMFGGDGSFQISAPEKVADSLFTFAKMTGNVVFVSDYIYSDAGHYEALTEKYREGLAYVDRVLAGCCQQVIEVAYGTVNYFKNEGGGEVEL